MTQRISIDLFGATDPQAKQMQPESQRRRLDWHRKNGDRAHKADTRAVQQERFDNYSQRLGQSLSMIIWRIA